MEFSGPSSLSDQMSLAIEGGTFNVRTATCGDGTYCVICVGLASCAVSPNPMGLAVASSSQATATGTYTNGSTENDTSKSSWSSSAASIATVETKGDANPGLVSGVSPGTATATIFANIGGACRQLGHQCPSFNFPGSSGGTVFCDLTIGGSGSDTVSCDGTTVYAAEVTIDGRDFSDVTNEVVTATTDNTVVIELVGGPYKDDSVCQTNADCWYQQFKTHFYQQNPSGSVIWNVKVYCFNHTGPDYDVTLAHKYSCQ